MTDLTVQAVFGSLMVSELVSARLQEPDSWVQ